MGTEVRRVTDSIVCLRRASYLARPVTPDIDNARASLEKCLELRPQIVCPGHREPLTIGVASACETMRTYLRTHGPWPLLG